MSHRIALFFLAFTALAHAHGEPGWSVARNAHFEVFSHQSEASARAALAWFEQLRTFFIQQTGLKLDAYPPVRVIGFRSEKEFDAYRLHPTADAYYAATETREYIVMAAFDRDSFPIAAHEYAHLVLHAGALALPPWLNEGLADFYSTLRIGEHASSVGGLHKGHLRWLRTRPWIPLPKLLAMTGEAPYRQDRESAGMFYAESAALTSMLVLAPEYAAQFPALLGALQAGTPIEAVFGRTADRIERDLREWAAHSGTAAAPLPGVPAAAFDVQSGPLTPFQTEALTAELLLAVGRLDAAEPLYRDLARQAPANAEILAALGTIGLRRGDRAAARREWKLAIESGAPNAVLCYRYAVLAGDAGAAPDEIRPALERALALNPEYDDARYTLALLEKNAGRYESALEHLRGMRTVAPARAFQYWSATADALIQLGRREEAKAAAHKAAAHAATPQERASAARLAYTAETEMTVRFTRDAQGRQQLVTTRVPYGTTAEWNPFVEPGDDYRRVDGRLREIVCSGAVTRLVIETTDRRLSLAIAEPARVQMRNAPPEFTCGPQDPAAAVTVEYAASKSPDSDGIVRGLAFQ